MDKLLIAGGSASGYPWLMAFSGRETTKRHHPVHFAAVGDVHGRMNAMVRCLQEWEQASGCSLDFVLQVGDFEPHRDGADLRTMAAPAKYKVLGDFPEYHSGKRVFPWDIYFIGGNHEPYGYLERVRAGGILTPRCRYLGRVGVVETAGIRIVGLSGIYGRDYFTLPRPEASQFGVVSNKAFIHFTEEDIDRALGLGPTDILLLHEWPAGLVLPEDLGEFEKQRRSLRYDQVGSEHARLLVELLRPKLVLCGHMHRGYVSSIPLDRGAAARVHCLGKVESGLDSAAFFRAGPALSGLEVL